MTSRTRWQPPIGERTAERSRLVYLAEIEPKRYPDGTLKRRVRCACDCGNSFETNLEATRRGKARSCGCLHAEANRTRRLRHGQSAAPIWCAWQSMKNRSSGRYPKATYASVKRDPRWETFEGFLDNQPHGRPFEKGLVLARIGDVGDYTPSNCRWATKAENSRDLTEHIGLRLPDGRLMVDVARQNGISPGTAYVRFRAYGWTIEDAVTIPVNAKFRRKAAA